MHMQPPTPTETQTGPQTCLPAYARAKQCCFHSSGVLGGSKLDWKHRKQKCGNRAAAASSFNKPLHRSSLHSSIEPQAQYGPAFKIETAGSGRAQSNIHDGPGQKAWAASCTCSSTSYHRPSGSLPAVLLHEAVVELLEALDDLVGLLLLHQDGGAEVVRALLLHRVSM